MKKTIFTARFWKKATVLTSLSLLAALFLYAAYNKLAIYPTFVRQLSQSPVTSGYEKFLAWFVPGIEILIALSLLFKRTRMIGFYSAFFLMLAFTAYVYIVPHFFPQTTCSCGGIISKFNWKQHFYFNILFTLLAATGLVIYSHLQNQKAQDKLA